MAALRMAFQSWLDGEPEEPDTDQPSEDQMAEFEEAEKAHASLVSHTHIPNLFWAWYWVIGLQTSHPQNHHRSSTRRSS